jgi:hypothetical protein
MDKARWLAIFHFVHIYLLSSAKGLVLGRRWPRVR